MSDNITSSTQQEPLYYVNITLLILTSFIIGSSTSLLLILSYTAYYNKKYFNLFMLYLFYNLFGLFFTCMHILLLLSTRLLEESNKQELITITKNSSYYNYFSEYFSNFYYNNFINKLYNNYIVFMNLNTVKMLNRYIAESCNIFNNNTIINYLSNFYDFISDNTIKLNFNNLSLALQDLKVILNNLPRASNTNKNK